jgi:hypothetical protein
MTTAVKSSTPRAAAAAALMDAIAYCSRHPDRRIIFEMNNHRFAERWTHRDGSVSEHVWNGYLMIDFSSDFGETRVGDGTFALVSSDFRSPTCSSGNVFYHVASARNLFELLWSLYLHGKLLECYVEGY